MHKVNVPLPGRAYDILIDSGVLGNAGTIIAPLLSRPKIAIVTEENVAHLHLKGLLAALDAAGITHSHLILPAGEGTKSWPFLSQTVEWLLDQKIERNDHVLALGGGVIGDLVGFAAAILRRGIKFIQMPTSLLAQVDSSIGGKTGINAPQGKNLIGAFHQPVLVFGRYCCVGHAITARFFGRHGRGGLNTACWGMLRFSNGLNIMARGWCKVIVICARKPYADVVK